MVIVEAVVVLGLVGVLLYAVFRGLARLQAGSTPSARPGVWKTAHYDVKGETRVVVQKVSTGGTNILDEHVVATIKVDDPDYDAKFLAAMASARERRSLFETEQE
jgi:hypothetical protein